MIDIALLVAFATAVHLLRQKLITVATLAHALSVAFLVFTVGHYIERHVIGTDEVEDLVSRRGPGQGGRGSWWLASWPTAGLLAIGAVLALGKCMVSALRSTGVFLHCKESMVCAYVSVCHGRRLDKCPARGKEEALSLWHGLYIVSSRCTRVSYT